MPILAPVKVAGVVKSLDTTYSLQCIRGHSGPFSWLGTVFVAIIQGLIDLSLVQFSTVIGKWELLVNQLILSKAQSLAQIRHDDYFGIESHCIQQHSPERSSLEWWLCMLIPAFGCLSSSSSSAA